MDGKAEVSGVGFLLLLVVVVCVCLWGGGGLQDIILSHWGPSEYTFFFLTE